MSLVGMFVPFVVEIYIPSVPKLAAIASMLVGTGCWLVHVIMDWEHFAEPFAAWPIPHELIDTGLSALVFGLLFYCVAAGFEVCALARLGRYQQPDASARESRRPFTVADLSGAIVVSNGKFLGTSPR